MSEDYSKQHGLVSDLFSAPASSEAWEQYRLSDEQVEFYRENGYLTGVRVLHDEQIEALREDLAMFTRPEHPGKEYWYEYYANESTDSSTVLFHALGAWRLTPAYHDILWNPAFLVPASQLLGGSVRFWHDQIFSKPAHHGGVVAWHQDYSYWTRTKPIAHLTCWTGLDDSTKENGAVHYIPGSHRWDLLPITGLAGDMDAIREVLSDEQWEQFQNPVAAEMKAGECSFHHPLTVHGSFANESDRPRRAFVINAVKDGVYSDTDEALQGGGVEIIPKGEPLGGQFYPLLYDAGQA